MPQKFVPACLPFVFPQVNKPLLLLRNTKTFKKLQDFLASGPSVF